MTKYEYKVLTESDRRTLEYTLNRYGSAGWKLVDIVWNNDESLLIGGVDKRKRIVNRNIKIGFFDTPS